MFFIDSKLLSVLCCMLQSEISDPVMHVAPAHNLEPPPESASSVVKLEWTCRKLGLAMPVFKVIDLRPKRGPVSYDCTCKVSYGDLFLYFYVVKNCIFPFSFLYKIDTLGNSPN